MTEDIDLLAPQVNGRRTAADDEHGELIGMTW